MAQPKKTTAPTSHFVVIKQDCDNVEQDCESMDEALGFCQDQIDRGNWDYDDLDYVRILEVTNVSRVTSAQIQAVPSSLDDIR